MSLIWPVYFLMLLSKCWRSSLCSCSVFLLCLKLFTSCECRFSAWFWLLRADHQVGGRGEAKFEAWEHNSANILHQRTSRPLKPISWILPIRVSPDLHQNWLGCSDMPTNQNELSAPQILFRNRLYDNASTFKFDEDWIKVSRAWTLRDQNADCFTYGEVTLTPSFQSTAKGLNPRFKTRMKISGF